MADNRFFANKGPMRLSELAERCGAEILRGDPELLLHDVAPLDGAGHEDLSFFENRRYLSALAETKAGAVVIAPDLMDKVPEATAVLGHKLPYRGYAMAASAFYPEAKHLDERHPSAMIDSTAEIGEGCNIGPFVVIEAGVKIGKETVIGAHSVIKSGVTVGARSTIGEQVWLGFCDIAEDCNIHPGVRIGTRGFGFAMDSTGHLDVPQLGRVIVGKGVEIGANSTVDRGSGPDTVIGDGAKIDNLVQIGHNVQVGRGCVLVAQSGVAGSSILGDFVALGAQAGVAGHLKIGAGAQLAAQSGVMRDIEPGQKVAGAPAIPIKEFFRLVAHWHRSIRPKGK